MATVLVISRHFPPLGSAGGSIRLVKIIKFLSKRGWVFQVLTQDLKKTVIRENAVTEFLLNELPKNIKIDRISAPITLDSKSGIYEVINKVFRKIIGDTSMWWGLKVFIYGLSRCRESQINMIFCVNPPFSSALICFLLGLVTGIPYVLDFKDDWVGSPSFQTKNPFLRMIETQLELLIVRKASAVVLVTHESHHLYQVRYQRLKMTPKFHLIPNGIDVSEFKYLWERKRVVNSEKFIILSSASGYNGNYRDATSFLHALGVFIHNNPDALNKVEVVFLGESLSDEYDLLISELKIDKIIRRIGSVGREELLEWYWKADLFFLIQPKKNYTAISGTLYEYWAVGKAPILLVSETGASSSLIKQKDLGKYFSFVQEDEIAQYIFDVYSAYIQNNPVWIEREDVEEYDREALAKKMEGIWKTIL